MTQIHFTLNSKEIKSLFPGNQDEAMAKVLQIILNHLDRLNRIEFITLKLDQFWGKGHSSMFCVLCQFFAFCKHTLNTFQTQ